jgi:hypothetical protein
VSGSLPKQREYFSLCAQGCVSVLSHVSNTCAGNTTPTQLAAAASERRQSVTECREQGAERARCVNIAPVCRLFFYLDINNCQHAHPQQQLFYPRLSLAGVVA